MYGKLFAQMYDGTLGTKGPWQALITFQQMVILADRHGVVDMTPEALSRRTTIPFDIITTGLAELEQPDPDSRSPDEEGRRIIRLDPERSWGWRIVNHAHYRKIRSEDERREYHRTYMQKRRAKSKQGNGVTPRKPVNTASTESTNSSKQYAGSRKQDAADAASPAAAPDSGIPEGWMEKFPESYRPDVESALRAANNPRALRAEIDAIASGMHPPAYDYPTIGRALHDLAVAGSKVTSMSLRGFCRTIAATPTQKAGLFDED